MARCCLLQFEICQRSRASWTVETTRPDLVLGASGYIGTNLVEYLLAEGRVVRASSRNMEVLQGRGWTHAEFCRADALDPPTLDEALKNVGNSLLLSTFDGGWKVVPGARCDRST